MFPKFIVYTNQWSSTISHYAFRGPGLGGDLHRSSGYVNPGQLSNSEVENVLRRTPYGFVEVTEEGFNFVLSYPREVHRRREIMELLQPYIVRPKPPPTNHRIGVPKHKLP